MKLYFLANTYDWIIETAHSKTNNAICVIIKIVNKDVGRKEPVLVIILYLNEFMIKLIFL